MASPFLAQFKAEKSAFPEVCRIFCMVPGSSPRRILEEIDVRRQLVNYHAEEDEGMGGGFLPGGGKNFLFLKIFRELGRQSVNQQ